MISFRLFYSAYNDDVGHLGVKSGFDHLHFESRFESGNLRKAIKVSIRLPRVGLVRREPNVPVSIRTAMTVVVAVVLRPIFNV